MAYTKKEDNDKLDKIKNEKVVNIIIYLLLIAFIVQSYIEKNLSSALAMMVTVLYVKYRYIDPILEKIYKPDDN